MLVRIGFITALCWLALGPVSLAQENAPASPPSVPFLVELLVPASPVVRELQALESLVKARDEHRAAGDTEFAAALDEVLATRMQLLAERVRLTPPVPETARKLNLQVHIARTQRLTKERWEKIAASLTARDMVVAENESTITFQLPDHAHTVEKLAEAVREDMQQSLLEARRGQIYDNPRERYMQKTAFQLLGLASGTGAFGQRLLAGVAWEPIVDAEGRTPRFAHYATADGKPFTFQLVVAPVQRDEDRCDLNLSWVQPEFFGMTIAPFRPEGGHFMTLGESTVSIARGVTRTHQIRCEPGFQTVLISNEVRGTPAVMVFRFEEIPSE